MPLGRVHTVILLLLKPSLGAASTKAYLGGTAMVEIYLGTTVVTFK